MGLAWQTYGSGHLAKSIHGYYLVYRTFDNEMKTNRWFAQYETGSDRFGQQVSRLRQDRSLENPARARPELRVEIWPLPAISLVDDGPG